MFPDAVIGALPTMQALAESLMTETFAAYSPNGVGPGPNGLEVNLYNPEGSTIGKLQAGNLPVTTRLPRTVTIGQVQRPVLMDGLQIPIDAPLPAGGEYHLGWEYECTAIGPESDPALLGRRYLVVSVPAKSYATARRLDVAEIPKEP